MKIEKGELILFGLDMDEGKKNKYIMRLLSGLLEERDLSVTFESNR